jgi:cytoskeletal protein CcmA (bactofilin family)
MNMNSKKNRRSRSGIMKRAGGLLNKDDELHEINYYHTGDINVQTPVYLAPSASVTGNITAPTVIVAGRMYGVIAADAVVIDKGGQIWGDIYCSEYHLQPGGKCYGWIISLDQGTIELLRSGALTRDDVPAPGERPVPAEFSQEHAIRGDQLPVNPEQIGFILRHLQAELASAQLARIEIELAFDERLREVFGQSEFRQQMEKELRKSIEADDLVNADAISGAKTISQDDASTEAITIQEQAQFEKEVRRYKLKAATCLEQLAWYRVLKAANESELVRLRQDLSAHTLENDRLRQGLLESKSEEAEASAEGASQDADSINQLKVNLAKAQLRIDELTADLSYYRHLDRGSDG